MKNKAFTIVELLVASIIIVVVLIGALNIQGQCFKLEEISHNKFIAVSAAQEQLEKIRALPFDDPGSTDDLLGQDGVSFAVPSLLGQGGGDAGLITLEDDPDYPGDDDIRQIVVSVDWIAQGKMPDGHVRLITRRCRY